MQLIRVLMCVMIVQQLLCLPCCSWCCLCMLGPEALQAAVHLSVSPAKDMSVHRCFSQSRCHRGCTSSLGMNTPGC